MEDCALAIHEVREQVGLLDPAPSPDDDELGLAGDRARPGVPKLRQLRFPIEEGALHAATPSLQMVRSTRPVWYGTWGTWP